MQLPRTPGVSSVLLLSTTARMPLIPAARNRRLLGIGPASTNSCRQRPALGGCLSRSSRLDGSLSIQDENEQAYLEGRREPESPGSLLPSRPPLRPPALSLCSGKTDGRVRYSEAYRFEACAVDLASQEVAIGYIGQESPA
jgi:hypothetical protein